MRNVFFLFVIVLFVNGCNNDPEEMEVGDINVEVFYKLNTLDGTKFPDIGAGVFIYYGKQTYDFVNYTYIQDGVFVKKEESVIKGDSIIMPDQMSIADSFGNVQIIPQYTDSVFTIIVESKYYSPRLTYAVFPTVKYLLKQITIFEP